MSNQEHVQIYVYKLPKKNHDAMVRLVKKFITLYRKYGTKSWDIYQLNSTDAMEGMTNMAKTVSASPDEEVWVEVDHYKDRKSMDSAMGAIMQDPNAGELFGELASTVSQGFSLIVGECVPVPV